MDFRAVRIEREGAEAVMQTVRNAETASYGIIDFPTHIPVQIELEEDSETECLVPIGGDGEPIHLEIDFTPDGAKILFIGQVAAEPLGRDSDDSDTEYATLDAQFSEWMGDWGTFLKVVIEPDFDGTSLQLNATGEVAILESQAEFDQYAGKPKQVFEDRPAKLPEVERDVHVPNYPNYMVF